MVKAKSKIKTKRAPWSATKMVIKTKRGLDIRVRCGFTKLVPLRQLKPHPENPHKHPQTQVALLSELITSIGWRYPIVVSKQSGFIVSGHLRLIVAKRLEMPKAPVEVQDFETEENERTQLLADNRMPELAQIDGDALALILTRLRERNANVALTGYDAKTVEQILKAARKAVTDKGQPIPEMELQPFEHYDYIVLMFKTTQDWMRALQLFKIKDVNFSIVPEYKRIGLGRVVDGARILQEFFSQEGYT